MSYIRVYSAKYLLLDTTRHHLVIIYDSASVSTIDKAIYNSTLLGFREAVHTPPQVASKRTVE